MQAMYMAYSNNPNMPRVRREAVHLVRSGWTTTKVARHLGFTHSAIVKWMAKAPRDGRKVIPTLSSRPRHHPDELSEAVVDAILAYRKKYERDAFFIHHMLSKDGVDVSLSSVKRTLKRNRLIYPSLWKKWHTYPPRPIAEKTGILIEIDTIHVGVPGDQLYVYTLLDVHSRWAHAIPTSRISAARSVGFVDTAREHAPFDFQTIQSDHGAEFSKWFTKKILERGLSHRHSRIRTPNDNAHLERFNRTIQQECLKRIPKDIRLWKKELPEYLHYYNQERPHMGLGMKTPSDMIKTVPSY
jgi:transposase InsO family protein